jgi:hypothetical protein
MQDGNLNLKNNMGKSKSGYATAGSIIKRNSLKPHVDNLPKSEAKLAKWIKMREEQLRNKENKRK